ncbi:MAG: SRPBCC domain-containing protein [Kangiellaceae bacterium]|nr:SRPBCC domain-containing protein [Kangiellaceae bacterium]
MTNYKRSISVSNNSNNTYQALTHGIEHWWTKPDSAIKKVGDKAKFCFPPGRSYWTFEAEELLQDKKVVLKCVDAYHLHQGQPSAIETEWLDSRLIWKLTEVEGQTTVEFEHEGLTQSLYCYDICEDGWDHFFVLSLQQYLDTGKGMPHT